MSDMSAILESSGLIHAKEALSALRGGWKEGRHSRCDISEIRRVYTVRLDRSRQSDSEYLKNLSIATAEMLDNLRTATSLSMCDISHPDGHSFVVFFSPTERRLLGCLSTVQNPDAAADLDRANVGGAV